MAISAIALCSRALLKIGASSITAFDEGTAESEIAANLYPSVRDGLLSSHPWTFATAELILHKADVEPISLYTNAFNMPNTFLRVLKVARATSSRGISYTISGSRLNCNSEICVLSHIFRPDVSTCPPFFDQAIIARLAAEFCMPMTDSVGRTEALFKVAEASFRDAKTIDAQTKKGGE